MSKLNKFLILNTLLTLLTFQVELIGQKESILIGGVEFSLGMEKAIVISKMEKKYFIEQQQNFQAYRIWDSDNKLFMIGVVQFDANDRLSNINKFFSDNNCTNGLQTLFMLLSRYESEGEITVTTQKISEPTHKAQIIDFHIGNRAIELFIKENGVSDISESLSYQ